MIDIKLKSGDHQCFNLKDRKNEKLFRDAWYSMSDTPKYANKELEAVTDKGETHLYKVCEIETCLHTDGIYDYSYEVLLDDLFEGIENVPRATSSTAEEIKKLKEIKELYDQIAGLLNEIVENIPHDHRAKIVLFLQALYDNAVAIDLGDAYLMETLIRVVQGNPQDVPYLVNIYINYWRNNRRPKEA